MSDSSMWFLLVADKKSFILLVFAEFKLQLASL
jgi:hypothetical protein